MEFSGENLLEFSFESDIDLVTEAVKNSASRLTAEDMEQLYGNIDDDDIIEICEQKGLVLSEDLREYEESDELDEDWYDDDFYDDDYEVPAKKPGFLVLCLVYLQFLQETTSLDITDIVVAVMVIVLIVHHITNTVMVAGTMAILMVVNLAVTKEAVAWIKNRYTLVLLYCILCSTNRLDNSQTHFNLSNLCLLEYKVRLF